MATSAASSSSQSQSSTLWLPAPTRSAPPPPQPPQKQQQPQQQQLTVRGEGGPTTTTTTTSKPTTTTTTAPGYDQRCAAAKEFSKLTPQQRRSRPPLFVPRKLADFDDGGAFPEIHVAQYPRNMGNPHLAQKRRGGGTKDSASSSVAAGTVANSGSSAIVNVEIDSKGEVSYDAVVTGGTNTDKKVYTRHEDLRGSEPNPEDVALPTREEEAATAERTGAALQSLVSTKLAALRPTGSAMTQAATSANQEEKTQFIKYTPDPNAPGYNRAASQRVIQMVPAQVDPMAPPKHMHRKAPRGPAEDPVPVLHAPPKKLTKEERDAWNVPACVSNWKNTRGYTIPLDKRLAADGRGLRENTINPNFATLSESLYVAERQAREEVRMRGVVQRRLAVQEKERREEELRELANKARLERTQAAAAQQQQQQPPTQRHQREEGGESSEDDEEADTRGPSRPVDHRGGPPPQRRQERRPDDEDEVAARQRERLRIERKKERERELRLENRKGGGGSGTADDDAKRRRLEEERDVSEKIALGAHVGHGAAGGAGEVDARLYNTSAGLDSGFGADDEYNAYSKPLFDRDEAARSIYKPTAASDNLGDADEQYDKLLKGSTTRFQPDKGFAGAEGAVGGGTGGPRTEPVQFEKEK